MIPASLSVPALTVTAPAPVAMTPPVPPKTRVPTPSLVMLKPLPATFPRIVRVLPLTVMVRFAPPSWKLPVVEVRLAVPVNTRLAPSVMPLLMVTLTDASRTPPLTVSVLPPMALLPPRISVPAESVVPPE